MDFPSFDSLSPDLHGQTLLPISRLSVNGIFVNYSSRPLPRVGRAWCGFHQSANNANGTKITNSFRRIDQKTVNCARQQDHNRIAAVLVFVGPG